jgi:hypothetical protein
MRIQANFCKAGLAAVWMMATPFFSYAGLSVTPLGSTSPAVLAAALVGPGVSISNVTYKTDINSSGFFSGGTTVVGFESGIVLSTGWATGVVGASSNIASDTQLPVSIGDADLTALVAGEATFDATVLEFDFVPTDSWIYMQYVFSSEEYNYWIYVSGKRYYDVMGIFLDGVNVATLPDGTYISVNTVNTCVNTQYYINNIYQSNALCPTMLPSANLATAMNGLTTVLNAIRPVTPNVKHHLKLAIADVGDSNYDSDVFFRTGSLQAGGSPTPTFTPTITMTPSPTPTFTVTPTPYPPIHLWPNPFNPQTAVRGTLKCENMREGSSLVLYTVSGEKIAEIPELSGYAEWNPKSKGGKDVVPGIYYYVVRRDTEIYAKGVWIVRYRQ